MGRLKDSGSNQKRFDSLNEFIDWYNDLIHGALWIEIGETPKKAR